MMRNKFSEAVLFSVLISFILSCSSKSISTKYYYQNQKILDRIEESYKRLNSLHPFSIAFTDRKFEIISFNIKTDSLSYLYNFEINDPRLTDTLVKFNFNVPEILELIQRMKFIRCTWINNYDYYVDETKNSLIFISVKPLALNAFLSSQKYYTLTYFPQPQYFDSAGQLLDKRKLRRLRKINGEIFKRINDKVCYTISGNFR